MLLACLPPYPDRRGQPRSAGGTDVVRRLCAAGTGLICLNQPASHGRNLVLRTQTSCRCLGHPEFLWPEASARGTHRTLLQRGHNNSRHALHSLHSLRVVPPGHLVLRTQQNMLAQSGKHGTHHPDTVSIGTISPPPEPVSDGKPDSSCVILSSRQDVAACEVAMPRKDSRQQEPHSEHPIKFKYGTGAQ